MRFQPVKGTRDFLPDDAEKMQYIEDSFRKTAELFGFRPIDTPALESFELLSAKGGLGEAAKDEIYYFKDKGDREIGLRFDMTMPLVRVASDKSIPKPFKRYAIGKVWRYDNPQKKRYREFTQADVDIVGSRSVTADVDIVSLACDFIENLGIKEYYVRFNSRKLIQRIFEQIVDKEKLPELFRLIDKMDKIGLPSLKAELAKNAMPILEITELLNVGSDFEQASELIKNRYGCEEEIEEISEFISLCQSMGIGERMKFDLSLVRGLDYYTGIVYEIYMGENVSFGAGGRYDNLVAAVGGGDVPAVGISMGIDRIFDLMNEKQMFSQRSRGKKVFVANVDADTLAEAAKICKSMRNSGIACEFDVMEKNLGKQMEYAASSGADYVIIVGKNELAEGKIKLKDMKAKSESMMTVDDAKKILLK